MRIISTFFYTLRQGIKNIGRNKLFSLASIATIGACLFLFGVFYAVLMNFQNMVQDTQENIHITVFYEEGTSEHRIKEIGTTISWRTEVSHVEYVSEEDAWTDMKESLGEYADYFGDDNPLRGSMNHMVYINDISKQHTLITYLESIDEVRKINRSNVLADVLTGVNALVAYATAGIIGILLLVSIFLISNTVTIGISVRREEINIMKYIGATDFFVRSPFVIEGILIGIIGAIIPLLLVYFLYENVVAFVVYNFATIASIINFLPVELLFKTLIPVSFGMGAGIGLMGSITTVRKHLRV
ncbi:MAG: permease-like cell division protein FtsX [Lachnospiraceae bacterium]|nr:permease-like cell division protein FtsX [Lachnospiraceae bacterium]